MYLTHANLMSQNDFHKSFSPSEKKKKERCTTVSLYQNPNSYQVSFPSDLAIFYRNFPLVSNVEHILTADPFAHRDAKMTRDHALTLSVGRSGWICWERVTEWLVKRVTIGARND